jgi:uncharacterized protein YxjI
MHSGCISHNIFHRYIRQQIRLFAGKRKIQEDERKTPRIYLEGSDLRSGTVLTLNDDTSHYLANVMRMKVGDRIRIFNG